MSISSPPVFKDQRSERRKFTLRPRLTGRQRRLGFLAKRLTIRRASRETSSSSSLVNSLKSFRAVESVSLAPGTLTVWAPALNELPQFWRKKASPPGCLRGELVSRRAALFESVSRSTSAGGESRQKLLNNSSKMGKSSTLLVRTLRKLKKTSSRSTVSITSSVVTAVTTSAGVTESPCALSSRQKRTSFSTSRSDIGFSHRLAAVALP